MSEAGRELILKRLRTYSTPPYNPTEHGDRRIAGGDRRMRSVQVHVERRSGLERRVRTQLAQYLQLRNISWQLIPE